jgi:tRNA-(ms[2]io[6]A)-hydroxylase
VGRAEADPDGLLLDLAHNEKKAAGAVLAFLFRDPGHEAAGILSRLAREELTHFEWCLRELAARNVAFVPQIPSAYAGSLARACRKGEGAVQDNYLVASIIEARSGERLALLRDQCSIPAIRELAAALCPPEERHVEILFALAAARGPVRPHLERLLAEESSLIRLSDEAGRIHS